MRLWTFMTHNIVEETTMSIFSAIMDKVFNRASAAQPASQPAAPSSPQVSAPAAAPTTQAPAQAVDVEAVLTQMASQKGGGGNWQTSIVDLLPWTWKAERVGIDLKTAA